MQKNKLHQNVNQQDYREWKALSIHELMNFNLNPKYYLDKKSYLDQPTESMILGSATHTYLLEEKKTFFEQYGILPKGVTNSLENRELTEIACKQHGLESVINGAVEIPATISKLKNELDSIGIKYKKTLKKSELFDLYKKYFFPGELIVQKEFISNNSFETIKKITQATLENKEANKILNSENKIIEASLLFNFLNIDCKGRPDLLVDDNILIDFKTTKNSEPGYFWREVINRKYHWQAAFYLDGLKECDLNYNKSILIATSNNEPFRCEVFELPGWMLNEARSEIKKTLRQLQDCLQKNFWPSTTNKIHKLSEPIYSAPQASLMDFYEPEPIKKYQLKPVEQKDLIDEIFGD